MLISILLFFSPFLAFAEPQQCQISVQNSLLNGDIAIPRDVTAKMNLSSKEVSQQLKQKEQFNRSALFGETFVEDLGYEYKIITKDFKLSANYALLPSDSSTSNVLLKLKIEYIVYSSNGDLIYSKIDHFNYDKNCTSNYVAYEVQIYTPSQNGEYIWDSSKWVTGRGVATKSRSISQQDFNIRSMSSQIEDISSIHQFELLGSKTQFSIIDEDNESITLNAVFKKAKPFRRKNLFTNKIESLSGVTLDINGFITFLYESSNSLYQISYSNLNSLSETPIEETLPRDLWLNQELKLSSGDEQNLKISGFVNSDFDQESLTMKVDGTGNDLQLYENSDKYFQVKNRTQTFNSWQLDLELKNPALPDSVAWDAPSPGKWNQFLEDSNYIQTDLVKDIAETLRPNLQSMNRLQASVAIIEEVTQIISYDHNAVSNDLVSMASTEQILATKKGVCQHYAGLFVAIARELGIPSRIVSGFSLHEDQIVRHAWVEVLLNDTDWWPLEPQIAQDQLPSRSYIPLSISWTYEVKGNDFQALLDSQIKFLSTTKFWEEVHFQK